MSNETQTAIATPKQPKKAAGKRKQPKKAAFRRCCAAEFRHFAKYVKSTTKAGNVTADNGDDVASKLRGLELDAVYARAAKVLGVSQASLKAKYAKLNIGMQRMNLGNRIRGATASAE